MSTASMSGLPRAVESVSELDHMPSNSTVWCSTVTLVFSTISPVSPLWTSMIRTIGLLFSSRRSRDSRTLGVVPICFIDWLSWVDEIPWV